MTAAREAGATVHTGPDQVGPLGSLAVLADPTRAREFSTALFG